MHTSDRQVACRGCAACKERGGGGERAHRVWCRVQGRGGRERRTAKKCSNKVGVARTHPKHLPPVLLYLLINWLVDLSPPQFPEFHYSPHLYKYTSGIRQTLEHFKVCADPCNHRLLLPVRHSAHRYDVTLRKSRQCSLQSRPWPRRRRRPNRQRFRQNRRPTRRRRLQHRRPTGRRRLQLRLPTGRRRPQTGRRRLQLRRPTLFSGSSVKARRK